MKAHLNHGGVTVSVPELKKIFDATDVFVRSGKFEEGYSNLLQLR